MSNYWLKAIGSIFSNVSKDVLFSKHRKFDFTKKWLSFGIGYENRTNLETIPFLRLYPEARAQTVALGEVRYTQSNATPYEIYCLLCVAMLKRAQSIFEIGTYDGATTYQFAKSCPESTIWTIDLAPEMVSSIQEHLVVEEASNVQNRGVGARYNQTPEEKQVIQLYGDSTQHDYRQYHSKMDLVFIDACHEYEFVRADSETALKLIKSDGVILWHDYEPGWPGVVRAVDELSAKYPIKHIDKTALAVLDLSSPSSRKPL